MLLQTCDSCAKPFLIVFCRLSVFWSKLLLPLMFRQMLGALCKVSHVYSLRTSSVAVFSTISILCVERTRRFEQCGYFIQKNKIRNSYRFMKETMEIRVSLNTAHQQKNENHMLRMWVVILPIMQMNAHLPDSIHWIANVYWTLVLQAFCSKP